MGEGEEGEEGGYFSRSFSSTDFTMILLNDQLKIWHVCFLARPLRSIEMFSPKFPHPPPP